jgi:DNA-binding transcriptional MerR regulator
MAEKKYTKQESDDRLRQVKRMREEGMTFKEIGEQFGVCLEHARVMYHKALQLNGSEVGETGALPVRVYNALKRRGITTRAQVIEAIKTGRINNIMGLGKTGIAEIERWAGHV